MTTTESLITLISTTNATTTPILTTEFIDIEKSCKEYYHNSTGFIIKDYEGIPENLLMNICAWTALLFVFTFIRKIGDYGRFGLIKNDEEKRLLGLTKPVRYDVYTSNIFQKKTDEPTASVDVVDDHISTVSNNDLERDFSESERSVNTIDALDSAKDSILKTQASTTSLTKESGPHAEKYQEKYIFSWIMHMWTLKDEHIKDKSGKDALYYLVFQRYLIVYLTIATGLSLSILLPINVLNFYIDSSDKTFSKTTITNVNPESPVLWVHLILSWVFLVLGVTMVKVFSKKMKYDEGEYVSRTVLITNYPIDHCEVDLVKKHFSEAYPALVVTDIQFAYDIRKLGKLTTKKRSMECGRIQSQKIFDQTNQRPTMHPFHLGSIFELCCCFCERCLKDKNKKVTDSIEFYTRHEKDLIVQIAEYKERVLKNPLGILFVTFQDQDMAAKFLKDYHLGFFGGLIRSQFNDKGRCLNCYICKNLAKNSTLSEELKSDMWNVKYATSPNNIIWENVSKYGIVWWLRVILLNLIIFILLIFFTTPSILLDKVTSWGSISDITAEVSKLMPDYLKEFLPSLILRLLAALLPVLVAFTALAELHWTRSSRNRSMMVKTYMLLLFMTLILPTLGLTSINALFQWLSNDDKNIKWRCVSDNGAFFIKYVTTFGLIGTALDLLRLPDLFLYLIKMSWSRSAVERHDVRQQVALEFNYGVEYAWILTMFTVTLSFSVVCPLITPFGLMYMVLKHVVDRYNLYFGYIPTKVDKRIHKTAVTFAIASFIMLQFCILFFIAVRNKGNINSNSMTTVQTLIITISCILFIGRLFFGFFKRISPFHKYSGSSCQISHDLDQSQSSHSELDTQESYNKLEHNDDDDEGDIQTEQPESAINVVKKKRSRNIFRHKNKKYEIFQSPFVPGLLRNISSDYTNISKNKKTKGNKKVSKQADQNPNTVIDFAEIIKEPEQIYNLPRSSSFAATSQIDLMLNSSIESNSIHAQKSNSSDSNSPGTVFYKASKESDITNTEEGIYDNNIVGLRNNAFQEENNALNK